MFNSRAALKPQSWLRVTFYTVLEDHDFGPYDNSHGHVRSQQSVPLKMNILGEHFTSADGIVPYLRSFHMITDALRYTH